MGRRKAARAHLWIALVSVLITVGYAAWALVDPQAARTAGIGYIALVATLSLIALAARDS